MTAEPLQRYAFVEKHTSSLSKNEVHLHLLIKPNERYEYFTRAEHADIFYRVASKILDDRSRPVFRDKCIDIRAAGDSGRIIYPKNGS